MAKKSTKSSKKKNSTLFMSACVLLGLFIILIIFLAKKDQIISNLKETNFFERVIGSTPEFVENHESSKPVQKETIPLKEETIIIETEPVVVVPEKTETTKPAETKPAETKPQKEEAAKPQGKKEEKKISMTDLQIYFVEIDSDGSVVRKKVKRSVQKNDSPLGTSLSLLLQGPDTTKSDEKNCMTLIPDGTKLLSAKVSNGVAYLNFNEAFEINTYGVEGYIGQLMQVVYTATEFSTVNSVQFLIEGEQKEYLGSEGQWIGTPLSRSSF